MNKTVLVVIGLLLVAGVGYYFLRGSNQDTRQPNLSVPAPGQESVPETVVGPADDESLSAQEIIITSSNFSFRPSNVTVGVGEPVVITFQNSGTHTFTVDELGINQSLRGSSGTVEFTPTQSGTFEFYCAIPGHKEQGMIGELIVN